MRVQVKGALPYLFPSFSFFALCLPREWDIGGDIFPFCRYLRVVHEIKNYR